MKQYTIYQWNNLTFYVVFSKTAILAIYFKKQELMAHHPGISYQQHPWVWCLLDDYFINKRAINIKHITIPKGTPFEQRVWQSLLTIPIGSVTTYETIAKQVNCEKGVRAVANAIAKNPLLIAIPCHRVIRKTGDLGGYRGGEVVKLKLLCHENANSKLKNEY